MTTLDKVIARFSCAYMSNAKWRKFFSIVNDGTLSFTHCVWKLVTRKEPTQGHVPDLDQLGDTFVGDCGALNGPFEFREIEWIFIPKRHGYRPYDNAPINYLTQDVDHILDKLQAIGQFEFEMNSEGLRVYGYKP